MCGATAAEDARVIVAHFQQQRDQENVANIEKLGGQVVFVSLMRVA
jgi:hypothetical protein